MFVKALHLTNFRSFRTEQTIEFGEKNVILGKNGSGKSNLLAAIWAIFLQEGDLRPQYGGDEGTSRVCVDIDNREKRFPLPAQFSLAAEWRHGAVVYYCDGRAISREELRGLIENAGLAGESIVRQGMVNALAEMGGEERFCFLGRVAGAVQYERNREEAERCLNEEGEAKIEEMLEQLDLAGEQNDAARRRRSEYRELSDRKARAEYGMMCAELREMTEEIERLAAEDGRAVQFADGPAMENGRNALGDDTLANYELRECRDRVCQVRREIDGLESYVGEAGAACERVFCDKENPVAANAAKGKDAGALLELERQRESCAKQTEELRRRMEAAQTKADGLASREKELYTYLKAVKYFEAMGRAKEDQGELAKRLEAKRSEIEAVRRGTECRPAVVDRAALMAERKSLWNKEMRLKEELKELKDVEKRLNGKMLYIGKQAVNVFEQLRGQPGVLGNVFSIFNVPKDIEEVFDAVAQASLFWIIVEDSATAARLAESVDGRATFGALDVINERARKRKQSQPLDDPRLIKLSDSIKCEPKFQSLLEAVCKDFYLCADLKLALELSGQYGINAVTMDGDVVRKSGLITGGYEKSQDVAHELRGCSAQIARAERALVRIGRSIKEIDARLSTEHGEETSSERILEDLMAVEMYLRWKLGDGPAVGATEQARMNATAEYKSVAEKLPQAKYDAAVSGDTLAKAAAKQRRIEAVLEKAARLDALRSELVQLREKEQQLIETAYGRRVAQPGDCSAEARQQRRHMLIDRRSVLAKRAGITDFRSVEAPRSKDALIAELKHIKEELKQYHGFDRLELSEHAEGERGAFRAQLQAVRGNKERIRRLIQALDSKKEQTIQLTFSMVAQNYSYYFKRITGYASELVLSGSDDAQRRSIELAVNGAVVNNALLSGGQKTAVALSLILAVQKNDPSPFYLFDEVDANLDAAHRARVYEIIGEETAQYFITSFKEESIRCGDRFYGIATSEKESFVGEIDRTLALETVRF
ncbi:structural maintenance of chromosome 3 (chondroitin sulfate proteoglycan 6) [Pancytospora philotis]|nr:structural maintenance of chromosome 3 (chondroitin sulfate proteoglycan 6) [Pancytospora philotis]